MTKWVKSLLLASALSCFASVCLAQNNSQAAFNDLLAAIWQYELSVSPQMATSYGIAEYDDKLSDNSPSALAEQDAKWRDFVAQLNAIDKESLDRESQITHYMQLYRLQDYIDSYRFKAHWVPLTSEYGFHRYFDGLPQQMPFTTETHYTNYLARLSALPRYFKNNIMWMKKGLTAGLTQPKVVLEGVEKTVESYLVTDPEKSHFYAPFMQFPQDMSEATKSALQAKARHVIETNITPAFQTYYDFLVDEYIPGARTEIAAKLWPDGEAFYQNRIAHYTTTAMTAKEIHDLGLQEVARIRSEMQTIVDDLEFEGSIDEFITFLRTDPQFYATSAEALLKEASFIAKNIDATLPKAFSYLPRTPYGVAPVPDSIAPKYTTGRYISPGNDKQAGYYWVNTYALDKRPLYALPALTLHEAVPGHHLQISLARELSTLPEVRQSTYISAFGEGWGLYSEFLGVELGIYRNEYEHFGRLSYEMWRACRLVVDTGMHMFGWTRQQALDYMLKNTALSEHNVKTEIDRYISWPAQALSYKIGEIKIKQLRRQAEEELGEDFDIRAFHKAVLAHGSIPLSVLEENVMMFIKQAKEG